MSVMCPCSRRQVVEPTGAETHVIGRVAWQRVIGVFLERITTRPGDFLSIALIPQRFTFSTRRASTGSTEDAVDAEPRIDEPNAKEHELTDLDQ